MEAFIRSHFHDVEYILYKYRHQYSLTDLLARIFNQASFELAPQPLDRGKWSYLERDLVGEGVPWVSWRVARGLDPAIHPFLCLTGFESNQTRRPDFDDWTQMDNGPFACTLDLKNCFALNLAKTRQSGHEEVVDLRAYAHVKILILKDCTVTHLDALTAPLRLCLDQCKIDQDEFDRAVGLHRHCRVFSARSSTGLKDIRQLEVVEALDIRYSDVDALPFFPTLRVVHISDQGLSTVGHCHSVWYYPHEDCLEPFDSNYGSREEWWAAYQEPENSSYSQMTHWYVKHIRRSISGKSMDDTTTEEYTDDGGEDHSHEASDEEEPEWAEVDKPQEALAGKEESAENSAQLPEAVYEEEDEEEEEAVFCKEDWDLAHLKKVQELMIYCGNDLRSRDMLKRLPSMDSIVHIPRLAVNSTTFEPECKEMIDLSFSQVSLYEGRSQSMFFKYCRKLHSLFFDLPEGAESIPVCEVIDVSHTPFRDCNLLPPTKRLLMEGCQKLDNVSALLDSAERLLPHELVLHDACLDTLDTTVRYSGQIVEGVSYKVDVRKTSIDSIEAFYYANELDVSECANLEIPLPGEGDTKLTLFDVKYPRTQILRWVGTPLTDFSLFTALRDLDIRGSSIDDVSQLGHLDRLILKECTKVRDVSALGRVRELDLTYCEQLEGTEKLTGVERLTLFGCTGVKDLSPFANAYFLDISGTETTVGLETLTRVPILFTDAVDDETREKLIAFDSYYVYFQKRIHLNNPQRLAPQLPF
jgi:hypothetical protein